VTISGGGRIDTGVGVPTPDGVVADDSTPDGGAVESLVFDGVAVDGSTPAGVDSKSICSAWCLTTAWRSRAIDLDKVSIDGRPDEADAGLVCSTWCLTVGWRSRTDDPDR